jgi:hypothetical protein
MSDATTGCRGWVIGIGIYIGLSLLPVTAGLVGCGDDGGTVDAADRGDVTATPIDDGPTAFASPGSFVVGSSDPCSQLEPLLPDAPPTTTR